MEYQYFNTSNLSSYNIKHRERFNANKQYWVSTLGRGGKGRRTIVLPAPQLTSHHHSAHCSLRDMFVWSIRTDWTDRHFLANI